MEDYAGYEKRIFFLLRFPLECRKKNGYRYSGLVATLEVPRPLDEAPPGVAEWLNATDLGSVGRACPSRGFESHRLRYGPRQMWRLVRHP